MRETQNPAKMTNSAARLDYYCRLGVVTDRHKRHQRWSRSLPLASCQCCLYLGHHAGAISRDAPDVIVDTLPIQTDVKRLGRLERVPAHDTTIKRNVHTNVNQHKHKRKKGSVAAHQWKRWPQPPWAKASASRPCAVVPHIMMLQPSFFWMNAPQLGQCLPAETRGCFSVRILLCSSRVCIGRYKGGRFHM